MKGDITMASAKKNVTVNKEETKPAAKAVAKSAETAKAEELKAEAPKAEEVKAEAPKTAEVKEDAAKAEKKTETKPVEKKKPGRKPAAKPVENKEPEQDTTEKEAEMKKELKSEITVQFGGKSYSQEELSQIAKDVWKYDLNQNEDDLTSIELYVKPEEHVAYYVMNKEFAGSFYL